MARTGLNIADPIRANKVVLDTAHTCDSFPEIVRRPDPRCLGIRFWDPTLEIRVHNKEAGRGGDSCIFHAALHPD